MERKDEDDWGELVAAFSGERWAAPEASARSPRGFWILVGRGAGMLDSWCCTRLSGVEE
jgi:hypothetical protein